MKSMNFQRFISFFLVIAMLVSFSSVSLAEEVPDPICDPPVDSVIEAPVEDLFLSSSEAAPLPESPVVPEPLPVESPAIPDASSPSEEVSNEVSPSEIPSDTPSPSDSASDLPISQAEDVPQNPISHPSGESADAASPAAEVPSDVQQDASSDPALVEEVIPEEDTTGEVEPEAEAAAEEEDTEEASSETDEKPEETALSCALFTFVSSQNILFTLYSPSGEVIPPATEDEIAAYLAAVELPAEAPSSSESSPSEEEQLEKFRSSYLLASGSYSYSASLEGYLPAENVPFEVLDSAEDELITITLEKSPLPYGLKGMPEGYQLSADELYWKQNLIDHNVPTVLAGLVPGVDYIEGEVCLLADSEEYARLVAEAYSADLVGFSYGVAVLHLNTATVLEAVTAAADLKLPLPVVEPNYIVSVTPIQEGGREAKFNSSGMSTGEVPTLQSWRSWYENSSNPDPCLKDPVSNTYQYMHDVVNTYEAWGVTKGAGIRVAVVDSGVSSHEDLPRLTSIDLNYSQLDPDTAERYGSLYPHGTHVAGIIAAGVNNGIGGAGIAPEASIVSVRVLDSYNSGSDAVVIAGINAAASSGIQIMNLSLGSYRYNSLEEQAIRNAINRGVTVVAAMGNDGTNILNYPASFDIPGLIAVQSTTESGALSSFSNYGAWADVSAPGSKIYSTVPGDYDFMSGTSMAAPVVAGVCALYMSAYGNPGPAEMERIIKSATTNGVIDASKLFISDKSAPIIKLPDLMNNAVPYGSAINLSSAHLDEGGCIIYTLDGKAPSVKDGQVVTGTVYEGPVSVTSENGFVPGKKITIKAACVSGMGVLGKVESESFTVGYAVPVSLDIQGAPSAGQSLIAGKSLTLTAIVSPAEADQTVKWYIKTRTGCPGVSINEKTGMLKTSASDSGSVTVMASVSGKSAEVKINVEPAASVNPVKTISLEKTYTLNYSSSFADSVSLIPVASDASGSVIPNATFRWSSSNSKVATVDSNGVVTAIGKGKATITCTATDGSNISAKCAVTVKQLVEEISITGQQYINPGKSVAFKAVVLPSLADNKTVTWNISSGSGVSVNSSGKVTVSSGASSGSCTVTAAANDGSGIIGSFTFEIRAAVKAVSIYNSGKGIDDKSFHGAGETYNKNSTLKEAVLYSVESAYWDDDEKSWVDASLLLNAVVDGPSGVSLGWSSSKPAVATVDESGMVRAVSAGTATITCKALDGSNKKASVSIKVINPASSVSLISSSKATLTPRYSSRDTGENLKILGVGKSVTNKVVLGDAFGTPSITKVTWDLFVEVYDMNGERQDIESALFSQKVISLSSSGAVSSKAKLSSPVTIPVGTRTVSTSDMNILSSYTSIFVSVCATTTDGTRRSGYMDYIVSPLQKLFGIYDYKTDTIRNSLTKDPAYTESYYCYQLSVTNPLDQKSGLYYYPNWNFTVKSSAPNVAGGQIVTEVDEDGYYYYYLDIYTGRQKGTAKLTITATDGSNKTLAVTVKVK